MRQILIIPLLCYLFLLLEFVLFNLFGRWGDPHLLLILVVFVYLYSGIRYSLWAAFWAGMFKDCFSTMPFGTIIFVYMSCACLAMLVRRYCYERGSQVSRLWMVFCMITAHTLFMGMLHTMIFEETRWLDVWGGIWFPEAFSTLIVTLFVFGKLGDLARSMRF